jgi:chorismate-pyruvate lyase
VEITARPAPAAETGAPGTSWRGSWTPSRPRDAQLLRGLPASQRLLLTTDGTLTAALATLLDEPIAVWRLGDELVTLEHDDDALALAAARRVLVRTVLLYGAGSRTPLLFGCSRIALGRLPGEVRRALLRTDAPIGLVLREHRIETFRSPLQVGIVPATADAAALLGDGLMCRRTYAIASAGAPLMVVDEQFPARGFGAQG